MVRSNRGPPGGGDHDCIDNAGRYDLEFLGGGSSLAPRSRPKKTDPFALGAALTPGPVRAGRSRPDRGGPQPWTSPHIRLAVWRFAHGSPAVSLRNAVVPEEIPHSPHHPPVAPRHATGRPLRPLHRLVAARRRLGAHGLRGCGDRRDRHRPRLDQTVDYIASGSWAQEGNRAVAIDENRVYRTELNGYWANGDYHVMAYDLQTGQLLWNRIIVGNGPVSAPSVGNGLIYVNRSGHSGISGGTSSDLPFLHAIDPATGATVLQVAYSAQWNTDERPAIDGNQLVSWNGYYGGMGSWNAATLTEEWRSGGSIYEGPKAAFDSQFIYAYDDLVYNRTTGTFVRELTGPAGYAWLDDPIVSPTGRVFFDAQNDQNYPGARTPSRPTAPRHTRRSGPCPCPVP